MFVFYSCFRISLMLCPCLYPLFHTVRPRSARPGTSRNGLQSGWNEAAHSKSGPTRNRRSFRPGPERKRAVPGRSTPSSARNRSRPQPFRIRSASWRHERRRRGGLAARVQRRRRRLADSAPQRRRDLLLAGNPLVLPFVLLFCPSSIVLGSCR